MKTYHSLLAILICFLWGINFIAAKTALQHFPIFLFLSLRMLIVAAVLIPFVKKPNIPWKTLCYISFTLCVLHFGMMFGALRIGLDVSIAVIIDQLRVPMAVILSAWMFNENIKWQTAFGIMIAFVGTILITGSPSGFNNIPGIFLTLGGVTAWAIYNMQIKKLGSIKKINILGFFAYIGMLGAIPLIVLSLIFESNQFEIIVTAPKESIAGLMYTAIMATVIAHSMWYYIISKNGVGEVVPYTLLITFFGVIAAVIILNEVLTWHIILGGLITIFGVAVIMFKRPYAAINR